MSYRPTCRIFSKAANEFTGGSVEVNNIVKNLDLPLATGGPSVKARSPSCSLFTCDGVSKELMQDGAGLAYT